MSLPSSQLKRTSSSAETLRGDDSMPPSAFPDVEKNEHEHRAQSSETHSLQEKETLANENEKKYVQREGSKQIVTIPLSDPEHPNNWSRRRKAIVIAGGIFSVIHSTLGSSLSGNAVEYIAESFGVTSEVQKVLPISVFLIGYVFAPTACGPLSEHFGRHPVMVVSFVLFTIFTMACAVAPSWATFLFFRFLCGLAASAPIACVAGLYADINEDPRARGRSMAVFMISTVCGPVAAPPFSGFIAENTSWRWVFGVAAIFAGVSIPVVLCMPETYVPVLTSKRAAKMRKETGNSNIIAKSDLQKKSFKYIMTVVMTRPYRMLFQELIVSTTCVYLALVYGVFYLYFTAYPTIFLGPKSVYKYSPGIAGLTFLPVALGSFLAGGIFLLWDSFLTKAKERKDPWAQKEEYHRLPLALLGGPLFGVAILWLGWSSRPDVFWLAPVASGIPFGMGFMLIFMAMLNYLSDAYMTFSASAQGIASTCRASLGVLLPLAAPRMFQSLGIAWACSTLAFLALALSAIPYLFIFFGEKIRANSKFCQELQALHAEELEERERDRATRPVSQQV